MVKPAEMTKISVTGPKKRLADVIDALYELELLDIEEYDGDLETGNPIEGAEDISETLVEIRSILSKLPEVDVERSEVDLEEIQESVDEIKDTIESIEDRRTDVDKELSRLEDQEEFFQQLKGSDLTYEDLNGTETLEVFIGDIDAEELREHVIASFEIVHGENADVVFYRSKDSEEVEKGLRDAGAEQYTLTETEFSGTAEEILQSIDDRKEELKQERTAVDEEFSEFAEKWRGKLETADEFLTEKVEKSEAPINFATTKRAFIAEGWIPSETLSAFRQNLEERNGGKIHIEVEEGESPPVKHENNKVVRPFEDLTDLVSVPKYGEVDPSFLILLTFPLFFGLMIGDAGYGITSGLVFFAGMKMFPKASNIFKALLWTSGATIMFGLLYGEMFGFQIYESPFYRADYWTEIFYLTIGIGVAHVNLGLLIGAYNEYMHHGLLEAIFAKVSWIFLQIAAVAAFVVGTLYGSTPGIAVFLGVAVPSVLMIAKGEGVEGVVEIPSLISNVLSYLRLFGVCIAAYTLAGTANAIASPALASGTLAGLVGGTLVLMVAHTILTFIKIMEGFLQGIRLHYVEMFGWFYEGGGRKYAPFGAGK